MRSASGALDAPASTRKAISTSGSRVGIDRLLGPAPRSQTRLLTSARLATGGPHHPATGWGIELLGRGPPERLCVAFLVRALRCKAPERLRPRVDALCWRIGRLIDRRAAAGGRRSFRSGPDCHRPRPNAFASYRALMEMRMGGCGHSFPPAPVRRNITMRHRRRLRNLGRPRSSLSSRRPGLAAYLARRSIGSPWRLDRPIYYCGRWRARLVLPSEPTRRVYHPHKTASASACRAGGQRHAGRRLAQLFPSPARTH